VPGDRRVLPGGDRGVYLSFSELEHLTIGASRMAKKQQTYQRAARKRKAKQRAKRAETLRRNGTEPAPAAEEQPSSKASQG
jgi:hypothetical protein